MNIVLLGAAGRRQGHPGRQARRDVRAAPHLHGRHLPQGRRRGHAARPRGQALHGRRRARPRRRRHRHRQGPPVRARLRRGLHARRLPAHGRRRPRRSTRRSRRMGKKLDAVVAIDVPTRVAHGPPDLAAPVPCSAAGSTTCIGEMPAIEACATRAAARSTSATTTRSRPRRKRLDDLRRDRRSQLDRRTTGARACSSRSTATARSTTSSPTSSVGTGGLVPPRDRPQVGRRDRDHARGRARQRPGSSSCRARPSRPGVTTAELDELAEATIREAGRVPAFKGYHGFPATLCTSLELRRSSTGSRRRTVASRGRHPLGRRRRDRRRLLRRQRGAPSPSARSPSDAQRLLEATAASLEAGIAQCVPGNRLFDIGARCRQWPRARASRWCASTWATGSAGRCTRTRTCPNYGTRRQGPEARSRAWSSRSSRW